MINWGIGKGPTIGFALAILALLVSGGLSYHNLRRIARNEGLVIHTHEVLDELRDTLQALAEAESSQRSYLITGDQTYFEPQHRAVAAAEVHLDRLKGLTIDSPLQQGRLTNLQRMINLRVASLKTGITRREAEGVEGARQYVLVGKGRREMALIRALVDEMAKN